jgi:hypothetical protein
MKHSVMILALLLATVAPAASDFTGVELRNICTSPAKDHPIEETMCKFYIAGLNDGLFGGQMMAQRGMRACIPPINGAQARLIVEKYMRDHPEELNKPAPIVIATAIWTAYPCKNSN